VCALSLSSQYHSYRSGEDAIKMQERQGESMTL